MKPIEGVGRGPSWLYVKKIEARRYRKGMQLPGLFWFKEFAWSLEVTPPRLIRFHPRCVALSERENGQNNGEYQGEDHKCRCDHVSFSCEVLGHCSAAVVIETAIPPS